jgi:hypothetical protein
MSKQGIYARNLTDQEVRTFTLLLNSRGFYQVMAESYGTHGRAEDARRCRDKLKQIDMQMDSILAACRAPLAPSHPVGDR